MKAIIYLPITRNLYVHHYHQINVFHKNFIKLDPLLNCKNPMKLFCRNIIFWNFEVAQDSLCFLTLLLSVYCILDNRFEETLIHLQIIHLKIIRLKILHLTFI